MSIKKITISSGILLASLIPFSTLAQDAKCLKATNKIADKLEKRIEKSVAKFESNLEKIKQSYLSRNSAYTESQFEIIQRKQRDRYNLDTNSLPVLRLLPKTIRGISSHPTDKKYCNDLKSFSRTMDFRAKTLDQALKDITEDIEYRIELDTLKPDEGLVLVSAYSYGYAGEIELKRKGALGSAVSVGPLLGSQVVKLVKVTRGEYLYSRVWVNFGGQGRFFDIEDNDYSFTVEPGKINLAGVFLFEQINQRGYAELSDRTGILLKILDDSYPLLAKEYDLHNALSPNDPFLSFYQTERASTGGNE